MRTAADPNPTRRDQRSSINRPESLDEVTASQVYSKGLPTRSVCAINYYVLLRRATPPLPASRLRDYSGAGFMAISSPICLPHIVMTMSNQHLTSDVSVVKPPDAAEPTSEVGLRGNKTNKQTNWHSSRVVD